MSIYLSIYLTIVLSSAVCLYLLCLSFYIICLSQPLFWVFFCLILAVRIPNFLSLSWLAGAAGEGLVYHLQQTGPDDDYTSVVLYPATLPDASVDNVISDATVMLDSSTVSTSNTSANPYQGIKLNQISRRRDISTFSHKFVLLPCFFSSSVNFFLVHQSDGHARRHGVRLPTTFWSSRNA